MPENKEPIYWRGELVGYISDPVKYPVMWRGKWLPESGDATQRFLREVRSDVIWVEYGCRAPRAMAQVKTVPGDQIELNLGIEESKTLFTNPLLDD